MIIQILKEFGLQIINGIGVTLLLAISGTIFGLIIAIVFGSFLSKNKNPFSSKINQIITKVFQTIIKVYVNVFRGTPMIVQAVLFYYTFYQIGINWSPICAGIFTISLNTGAYLTEIIRSSIASISKEQKEAGLAIGFTNFQVFILITLPQALKNAMAAIGNELIINIKDSAVLGVITIVDLYGVCEIAAGRYGVFIESMLIAAAIYLCLTIIFSKLFNWIEKKIGAPTKPITSSN